jgi:glycerophosphoryl diester phosphodiesterase
LIHENLIGWVCAWLLLAAGCAKKDGSKSLDPVPGNGVLQVSRGLLVANSLGAVDGSSHAGALEALQCNHKRGFRWFEVDVAVTSDGKLVCFNRQDKKGTGLPKPIHELTVAVVDEANRLGDVVLVLDTRRWSKKTSQAVGRAIRESEDGPHAARFVLQAYSKKDLGVVDKLAKQIDASVLLNLHQMGADDAQVVTMAAQHRVLAVLAGVQRFTPWLAERLHERDIPILVNTVNEHKDVLELTRAGADGFFTDHYLPYGVVAKDPTALYECGAAAPSSAQLLPWLERDAMQAGQYSLAPCARRLEDRVELEGCGKRPAVYGVNFAVPPKQAVRLELDAEAPANGARFWLEMAHENRKQPARAREALTLAANERRLFTFDVPLPNGSPGIETRLGLESEKERLVIYKLRISQQELSTPGGTTVPTVIDDTER